MKIRCPSCQSLYEVTLPSYLRKRQWLRCGRCHYQWKLFSSSPKPAPLLKKRSVLLWLGAIGFFLLISAGWFFLTPSSPWQLEETVYLPKKNKPLHIEGVLRNRSSQALFPPSLKIMVFTPCIRDESPVEKKQKRIKLAHSWIYRFKKKSIPPGGELPFQTDSPELGDVQKIEIKMDY